ncbi:MAG: TonB-dependent receptor [Sinimarinibacterium sp.]
MQGEAEPAEGDASAGEPGSPEWDGGNPATSEPPPDMDAVPALETIPVSQLSPELAEQPPPPPESAQLEEIVVTATKRAKSLRDIPASISAFDGDKLEEQGKLDLGAFIQESPGVTATVSGPGVMRIAIRGISTDAEPLSTIPSASGILIGDVAFSDPYISNITPDLSAFDLESVEILKGPQGTLFGGSALSGAVRYVLQEPSMYEWQLRGFTQYVSPHDGSYALTSGVAVNVPVYEDRLAVRLGYVKREYPGVYDLTRDPRQDDVDGGDGDQVRAMLSWQATDALKFKLTHLDQDFEAANTLISATTRDARENSRIILPQPASHGFDLDSLEIGYDFDTVRLVSLSSRSTKNLTFVTDITSMVYGDPPAGTPEALTAFQIVHDDSEAFAQELRIQSTGPGTFQWLAGAYYYDYSVYFDILDDTTAHQQALGNDSLLSRLLAGLGVDSSSLYNDSSLLYAVTTPKAQERALFFDLSDTFWEDLELSAGARLYSTEVKGGFRGYGVLARAVNNGMDVNYDNNRIQENGVSPRIAATYHFGDDISLYTQASRGFRFGGLQSVPSTPTNDVPPVYKSDSLWNYELGLRTNWLERTLRFDITAFYIDYKNPQIQQTTTGVPLNYTDNVSAAVSKGFEASLRWITPLPGLMLALDGGLTDAHITEPFTASDGTLVEPGAEMPGAAKSQYSASMLFFAPLGLANVAANLGYTYVGKGYGDIVHSESINDFGTLNGGFTLTSDAWSVRPQLAFSVANILDVTAAQGGSTRLTVTQQPVSNFQLNPPRTFTIRLGLEF